MRTLKFLEPIIDRLVIPFLYRLTGRSWSLALLHHNNAILELGFRHYEAPKFTVAA